MNSLRFIKEHKIYYFAIEIIIFSIGIMIYILQTSLDIYNFIPLFLVIIYILLKFLLLKYEKLGFVLIPATLIVGYSTIISAILLTGGIRSFLVFLFPIGAALLPIWYSIKLTFYCIVVNIIILLTLWGYYGYSSDILIHNVLPISIIMICELLILSIVKNEIKYYYEEEILYQRDNVTGLHTYRYFQKFLEKKIQQAKVKNFKFAIYLLDIEGLQRINELLGYSTANQILAQLANVINQKRCFENIFFNGGGCFIAYERVKGIDEAERKAEEIKQFIVGYPFLKKDKLLESININVGWAVYPFEGTTKEQLQAKASEKLDENKRLRRQEKFEYKNRIEKLTLIGELAAGFAHEIKNPLTTVKGFCQLVKELPNSKNNSYYMDIAIKEIDRVCGLLSDFLKLTKVHEPKLERVNIKDFLKHVEDLVMPQMRLYEISFYYKIARGTPDIFVDKKQMTQVFLNLIINAIHATKGKEGEISIVCYPKCKGKVAIEVNDNGTGIEKEKLNKIFEPFYSSKEEGTGLGLPISHKIVEAHDGDIKVKSIKGVGTTFTILLPAYNSNARAV